MISRRRRSSDRRACETSWSGGTAPCETSHGRAQQTGSTTAADHHVSRRAAARVAGQNEQGAAQGILGRTLNLTPANAALAGERAVSRVRTGATASGLPGGQGVQALATQSARAAGAQAPDEAATPAPPSSIAVVHQAAHPTEAEAADHLAHHAPSTFKHTLPFGRDIAG